MSNIVDLQERRATAEADEARRRLGSWNDWSEGDIRYLLNELAEGHWNDCGDKVPGFAVAMGGLNMAIAANSRHDAPKNIELVLNGMWIAADYLLCSCEDNADAPRAWQALRAIHAVTKWTGGMPPLETDEADLLTARDGLLNGVG